MVIVCERRFGARVPRLVRGVAARLEGAWAAVRNPTWRLLDAVGFLCLDMAALWAACTATGHRPGFVALLIADCIGYLATAVPMPAGLGVLDSGLAGALVLYGLSAPAAVGAVLMYHAISIWVPGLGGLIAWSWKLLELFEGGAGSGASLAGVVYGLRFVAGAAVNVRVSYRRPVRGRSGHDA
jgi:hypothetical protein